MSIINYQLKLSHLQECDLFWGEETPFAATYVFLCQSGEGNTIEVDYLVSHFLEDSAYHAVLAGVNLQTNMFAVFFGEFQCIRNNTLIIQNDTITNLIYNTKITKDKIVVNHCHNDLV